EWIASKASLLNLRLAAIANFHPIFITYLLDGRTKLLIGDVRLPGSLGNQAVLKVRTAPSAGFTTKVIVAPGATIRRERQVINWTLVNLLVRLTYRRCDRGATFPVNWRHLCVRNRQAR
ncbi:MAG: hypothetical protein QOI94_1662, partial [Acidobacteriaceae bacterium]|nr:hypothetical protein [Acidobacteriaceae bacterium]